MIAKRVPHQFPSGPVEETIRMYEPMIVLFSLFYCIPAALAGWLIWRGLYPEQIVLNGVIFLFCLWRIAQQDKPLVFICQKGFVFYRRPLRLQDRIWRMWQPDAYYLFVPYESIIGFTPDWRQLHINYRGSILIVAIDMEFVSHKSKRRILQRLSK